MESNILKRNVSYVLKVNSYPGLNESAVEISVPDNIRSADLARAFKNSGILSQFFFDLERIRLTCVVIMHQNIDILLRKNN